MVLKEKMDVRRRDVGCCQELTEHYHSDPRISSIAPSIAVEAPDNQAAVPPPAAAPEAAPVELPASADPGNSPLPAYKPRFSFAGQEADYRPSKEQS